MSKIKQLYHRFEITPVAINYIAGILIILSVQTPLVLFLKLFGIVDDNTAKIISTVFSFFSYFAITLKLYAGFEYNKARPNIFSYFAIMALGALGIYIADIIVAVGCVRLGLPQEFFTGDISIFLIPNFPLILLLFSFVYFFLFYIPKRFKLWQLIIFRLLAILPIVYIFASSIITGLVQANSFELSTYLTLLMPSKSFGPSLCILIVMIAQYIYNRIAFKKYGEEQYFLLKKNGAIQFRLNLITCSILILISILSWIVFVLNNDIKSTTADLGRFMFILVPLFLFFAPRKRPGNRIIEAAPSSAYILGYALLIVLLVISLLYV